MVRSKQLVAFAAAGALVLAACGSDDDSDSGASDAETEATEAVDEAETAVTEAVDEAETEATEAVDEAETEDTEAMDEAESETSEAESDTTEATGDDGGEAASGPEFVVDTSNCEDPDAATAPIEDTIKIGTSIPLSGGPAVLFAPFGVGQQAYIDYFNSELGGVDGQEIELIIKDDQYTADLTVANVDELVFDDEVDLLSGIIGSPNNLAVEEDLNAQCIPQLNASTGAPDWGDVENNPWTTGLLVPYAIESRLWAEQAASEGATTAGLFYVNNEFGQAYADAFEESAAENGIEIVATETIEPADSGAPSGQVTNLVSADPDTILAVPLGAQCIAFMTELGNQKAANPDFDATVYQTATCASPLFFQGVTNGGADGVFTSANLKDLSDQAVIDGDEGVSAYAEAITATNADTPPSDLTAAAGWLSMEIAVQAIQEAAENGNLSREGIINAARNVNFSSPLLLDGLTFSMNAEDGYLAEGTQLRQWSDADKAFVLVGEPVDYNGSLGVYEG